MTTSFFSLYTNIKVCDNLLNTSNYQTTDKIFLLSDTCNISFYEKKMGSGFIDFPAQGRPSLVQEN